MPATRQHPVHILDLLKDAAVSDPSAGLLYLDKGLTGEAKRVPYAQLLRQAEDNAILLRKAGIFDHGRTVITYFDTHEEHVLWFWSVIAAGGVCAVLNPISNDPKSVAGQLDNLKSLFGETPVVTTHKLSSIFAARRLNVRSIEDIQTPRKRSVEIEINGVLPRSHPLDSDKTAAIVFTSGSTGHSKAVKYSHAALIASVQAKAAHLSTHGLTFMSWISFDHSACLCEVHLQALFVRSDQVFAPTADVAIEPHRYFEILSRFRVGYTFSPNSFLAAAANALAEHNETGQGIDLGHLRVLFCGGEANRTATLQATDHIIRKFGAPKRAIKPVYGLSETCSACFYNLEGPGYDVQRGNVFASAGKPLPSVLEVKLVDPEDDQKESAEGLIHLRGDVLFQGYHNNEEAMAACMTEDGWMNTGDIGKFDENGNLLLLGRAKEVLILNGQNYSSFEIEHAIETSNIDGLTPFYTAVFSTWDQDRQSEAPIVLFNPTEAAIGPKNLRATLQAIEKCVFSICAQKALHIIALPKALLPKSTIGKLSRAKLKKSFESGAFDDFIIDENSALVKVNGTNGYTNGHSNGTNGHAVQTFPSPLQKEIAQIYASIVGVSSSELMGQDALLSSGINSMGFMRLKKALEKNLKIHQEIPMPLLIRCHSIADLEHELTLLGTVSQQYDPIVPLFTEGSKQPLFLLHPGAGEFLCWIGLLKYLPDRPIYALRAKGLHPGEGIFEGLEDLLQCYYDAIRRVQPHGPYAMLGYCFGGLLGFELGKMFEAAGESVVYCGGIDNPPDPKPTIGQVQYRKLMIDVLPVLTELTEDDARKFADDTAHLTDEEFYKILFTKFSPELIENMDITVPRLQAYGRVEDVMRQIASKYEPSGDLGTMDIFCADPMPHFGATPEVWKRDVLGGWREFVRGENVNFHNVQGTHISLIKEPHIKDFQRIVNEAFEKRGI